MTTKQEIFRCDRRDILKYGVAAAAIGTVSPFQSLFADAKCENVTLSAIKEAPGTKDLFFWIDGPFGKAFKSDSAQVTRARFGAFVDFTQKPEEFVEYVALLDGAGVVLAANYYSATDKISGDKLPYVIFDQLSLDPTQDHTLIYLLRSVAQGAIVYKYGISKSNIRPSRLDYSHLSGSSFGQIPASMTKADGELAMSAHRFDAQSMRPGFGYLSNAFENFVTGDAHQARARIISVGADGSFDMEIDEFHGYIGPAHYMRYLLVLDPAGRPLGIKRRVANEMTTSPFHVNKGTSAIPGIFTEADTALINARNISDCPYVLVIIEDIHHAASVCTVRIR